MSKLFLVRHAQSAANHDREFLYENTNISTPLTNLGVEQAKSTGEYLASVLSGSKSVKVWNSPYVRTRQTASAIKEHLTSAKVDFSEEETIYISERQFGLLDDNRNIATTHKEELEHYYLHVANKHDFWARPPLGESPFDMCIRLDFFLRCILHEKKFDNHVVVCHGAAIKGLVTMHQKLSFESYSDMTLPANSSVVLIDNNVMSGVVFCPDVTTGIEQQ